MCDYSLMAQSDDVSMKRDNPIKIYIDLLRESMLKMDRSPPAPSFLKNLLEKAGFQVVKRSQVKEPLDPWAKDPRIKRIGAMVPLHSETVFESYGMAAFTRVLGMDQEKARDICDRAMVATRNKSYHTHSF
jgi:protein-tyrosine-phosphatase